MFWGKRQDDSLGFLVLKLSWFSFEGIIRWLTQLICHVSLFRRKIEAVWCTMYKLDKIQSHKAGNFPALSSWKVMQPEAIYLTPTTSRVHCFDSSFFAQTMHQVKLLRLFVTFLYDFTAIHNATMSLWWKQTNSPIPDPRLAQFTSLNSQGCLWMAVTIISIRPARKRAKQEIQHDVTPVTSSAWTIVLAFCGVWNNYSTETLSLHSKKSEFVAC